MTDLEFLQGIRSVLSSPEKWTQGRLAKDATGGIVKAVDDPTAACWCIIGAGYLVDNDSSRERAEYSLWRLLDPSRLVDWINPTDSPHRQVVLFNDDERMTYDFIAKSLDDAIARLLPPPAEVVAQATP